MTLLPIPTVKWDKKPIDAQDEVPEQDLSMERLTQVFTPLKIETTFLFHFTIIDKSNKRPRFIGLSPAPMRPDERMETSQFLLDLDEMGNKCSCQLQKKGNSIYFLSLYTEEEAFIIASHPVKIHEGEVLQVILMETGYRIKVLGAIRV